MNAFETDAFAKSRAVYVHIPFCAKVCPYCDFAVVEGRDDAIERYVDAVIAEISMASAWGPLEAVYFGGGTPSHLAADLLGSILATLDETYGLAPGAEVSLEANPEDFSVDGARALKGLGFNRVSFGAQSFDPSVLAELGRRHHPEDISTSVSVARKAGFDSVSIDLIFGASGETEESWLTTLRETMRLQTDHISCYALTVERGTPLGRAVAAGAPSPDPDTQADRYEKAASLLEGAGFERYEVSNWARAGHECRYNLVVWAQGEYEAFGNGAHGYRDGVRYRNHRRLDAYLAAVEEGRLPRAGQERIAGWDAEIDRLFVGLRRTVGVVNGPGTEALITSQEGGRLLDSGVIAGDRERLRVMRPLLTDAVHRSVLAQRPPNVTVDDDA